jgi:hypothetical protein
MGQFLIKVDPSACPAGIGRPIEASQWANGWFDLTAPSRPYRELLPAPFDYCLIWVNELPREQEFGEGLIAVAIIQAVGDDSEQNSIQIFEPQLFRSPRVNRDVIQRYETEYTRDGIDHIIIRIHKDRPKTLRYLSDADVAELLGRTGFRTSSSESH